MTGSHSHTSLYTKALGSGHLLNTRVGVGWGGGTMGPYCGGGDTKCGRFSAMKPAHYCISKREGPLKVGGREIPACLRENRPSPC